MPVTWSDGVDDVIRGDLTCGFAYITPAGGAVVTAVAPLGLSDRERGTVGFTTSLGFGRKLERIKGEPRVALTYHAREHGIGDATNQRYVLVQGDATFDPTPTRNCSKTSAAARPPTRASHAAACSGTGGSARTTPTGYR